MIHALLLAVSLSSRTVDSVLENMEKAFNQYIYPSVAAKTVEALRQNTPRYERLTDTKAFVAALNRDLYASTHDKHVHVLYPYDADEANGERHRTAAHQEEVAQNYGFINTDRLLGNVGYIDFQYFSSDSGVADAIESAMRFVAGTDALIIDIRGNGGGNPVAAQIFEGYFFTRPKQMTSIILRNAQTGIETERQQYTAPIAPALLYLDKPIYLLTSKMTFSCAEQFAYDLQNLKRVTIVGERTAGGANPGRFDSLGDNFAIFMPDGRAYSNVTKTNWEDTGVTPDVPVAGKDALVQAYTLALRRVKASDKNPGVQGEISLALKDPAKGISASWPVP